MCDRQTDRYLQPGCKSVDDVVLWTYKDLPRPRVPCNRTGRHSSTVRPDCIKIRGQDHSSIQGENTLARPVDEFTYTLEDWDDARDPYNNTATGFLGVRRKSMLRNPLLVKHKIGASFRCCRKLPCDDFTYGTLPTISPSAALALRGWDMDLKCKTCPDVKKQARYTNFLALNRAAVTSGVCGHDDWRDFRNTHRITYCQREIKEHERRAPPVALDPNATFGKPNSYNCSAAEVLSGQELKDWLRFIKACSLQQEPVAKIDSWKENHACTLRMFKKPTGLKPEIPWHMPKFEKKAKPHLSTFRNTCDEMKAHNANNYEKIGRDGMFGQGIATRASNRTDAISCYKP